MLEKKWAKLKSGTDIRGVAVCDDVSKIDLTDQVVEQVTKAFAKWLSQKTEKNKLSVAVGHDSRVSAKRITKVIIDSLIECGIEVFDCGLASTPSMFMATISNISCDASIEVTASHHPFDKNGLKFFTKNGGLDGSNISEILEIAQKCGMLKSKNKPKAKKYDFMNVYCNHLKELVCSEVNADDYFSPLKGLKIIVDAGNGVGGFYAKNVLSPLGADISGSQFLEPDGMFPNHIPNPENKEAMDSACTATVKAKADLGIIFDTDVDRMGCVDGYGNEINRNKLIALASVIALENCKGGTIVTDSVTSDGLRDFIENELSAKQLRFMRGYKNVINKSIELNKKGIQSPLAIETSGHAALKENHFLDDGAYLATKIVIKLAQLKKQGKDLNSLIEKLKEPAQSEELRFNILCEDFRAYGNAIIEDLEEYVCSHPKLHLVKNNYEGIRVNFKNGWFLLRLSVHDPIMPMNIECDTLDGISGVIIMIKNFLSRYDLLDLSDFDKFI